METLLNNKTSRIHAISAKADYQPIENYGIIGDLHTVALVGMDGSIDFMSFPHFDSPTIFAALLDNKKGVVFKLRHAWKMQSKSSCIFQIPIFF